LSPSLRSETDPRGDSVIKKYAQLSSKAPTRESFFQQGVAEEAAGHATTDVRTRCRANIYDVWAGRRINTTFWANLVVDDTDWRKLLFDPF